MFCDFAAKFASSLDSSFNNNAHFMNCFEVFSSNHCLLRYIFQNDIDFTEKMRKTQVVHANDPNAQNPVISRNLKLVPSRSSICPLRYCLSIRKLGFAVSKESFSAENSKM